MSKFTKASVKVTQHAAADITRPVASSAASNECEHVPEQRLCVLYSRDEYRVKRYTNLRVIFMGVFTIPTKMKKGNEKMVYCIWQLNAGLYMKH